MDRVELAERLLYECTLSAAVVNSYLEKPRRYAEADDLYMREVHFVVAVGPGRSPSMSEMAQQLNVTQGAVTQMVTRLEKKGYLSRAKDARDKRVTTVTLTPKGEELCARHILYDRRQYTAAGETLSEFSDADLERLIHYEQLVREIFIKPI